MMEKLRQARALLRDLTPLKNDCGRICGAACCRTSESEKTGMLLFPGEEVFYENDARFDLQRVAAGMLLTCNGACDRENRPLACRVFPLLPVLRDGEIRVETDLRAKAVCPLALQGKRALCGDFADAVGEAGKILIEDEIQKQFIQLMTEEQDALKELRKKLSR